MMPLPTSVGGLEVRGNLLGACQSWELAFGMLQKKVGHLRVEEE